ncbi:MAG: CPBP family intramembrane metalloprotease [Methanosphaera stadtmanae]|nr:CPBP family intramembrane metalloprotease [Methanosphaera stadtmanae]
MSNVDFFDFEDKSTDFPFYKENNVNEKNSKIIILSSLFLFIFMILGPVKFYEGQEQIILFLITLIPLLLLTKCNLSSFFRKLSLNDIRLIIVSYIGYKVYYLIIYGLFQITNYTTTSAESYFQNINLLTVIVNLLQIFSEEIFRIFIFLILMYYLYKYTNNRKMSIIISTVIMLIVFGLLHVNTYGYNIIQIMLFQGLGSIFEFAGYLKTKNLAIPILIHILINISSWFQFLI